jgi:hypothetical protein
MTSEFLAAMDDLVSAYPGVKFENRHFKRYWRVLEKYPISDIRDGIEAAVRHYTQFVPNAGQLRGCVQDVRRHRETDQRRGWDGRLETLETMYPDTDFRELVRTLPEGHVATQLAIQWSREDRERTGGKPGYTPKEIGQPRFRVLQDLMGDKSIAAALGRPDLDDPDPGECPF